jgi:hypothetical protein
MTVGLSPVAGAGWQFFDANGVPLSGGKLYTYVAGTTTPQATYTSSSGLTPNANPIILNSEGRVPGTNEVWLDSAVSYKLILQTSASVQLWSADDLSGIAGLGNALSVASGGTGVSSNTAYAVLCGGTTATNPIQSIASVGTAGQVLTSNGASALPTMQAAFISGMIILWSGSVVSIPAGWLLCNGASSTPDLRDRFVVGAGLRMLWMLPAAVQLLLCQATRIRRRLQTPDTSTRRMHTTSPELVTLVAVVQG